jgi:hypothetical protein
MITIFVPDVVDTGTFEVHTVVNGNSKTINYEPRAWCGYRVLDCPPAFFRQLLSSSNGLLWLQANPEAVDWLGAQEGRNEYCGEPFPGEHRQPRVAAVTAEAPTVMVKMRAPIGTSGYSHGGVEGKIGDDGCVTVAEHVAADLRWHGFLPT